VRQAAGGLDRGHEYISLRPVPARGYSADKCGGLGKAPRTVNLDEVPTRRITKQLPDREATDETGKPAKCARPKACSQEPILPAAATLKRAFKGYCR
jgi:hypothetical protein